MGGRGAGTDRQAQGTGGSGYSASTLKSYERTLRRLLIPQFGGRHAIEITEVDWQRWVNRLSEEGLSRSRIANMISVVTSLRVGRVAQPYRRFMDAAERVGLRPVRFHDLRHSPGTQAVQHNDVYTLQRWLGHKSITTTEKYLHYKAAPEAA